MRNPDEPATSQQKDAARRAGLTFPADITKGEMSSLLDDVVIPPSEEQIKFAAELKIEVPEGISSRELGKRLTDESNRLGREAVKTNPALKQGNMILYKGRPYTITRIGMQRGRYIAGLQKISYLTDMVENPETYRTITVSVSSIASAEKTDLMSYRDTYNKRVRAQARNKR